MTASLLREMTERFPTEFWNDACDLPSLRRAVALGATGATTNPVIVLAAIKEDEAGYRRLTTELWREDPEATEAELAWRLVEHAARAGAEVLAPVFTQSGGRRGRLSAQVDPTLYPNAARMVAHGEHLARLGPNIAIKVPAVPAGISAIEELTARGVVTNATVCFTLPQALAVAEAVERGVRRAAAAGLGGPQLTPYCTIMVGRLDDHLRDQVRAQAIDLELDKVRFASTATFRKAYRLFKTRGYRATLLAAAMRSHHHWSDFIGGEVVITIPPNWQPKFDASGVELRARIDEPVAQPIIEELLAKLPDFRRAYAEDGLGADEFLTYGATVKTLHQFLAGYQELLAFVRAVMLPRG